jgi:hypothetical protein
VFHFEQTNPIQPLKLRLSYLFIFAISSAGSGLLSFSRLPSRPNQRNHRGMSAG